MSSTEEMGASDFSTDSQDWKKARPSDASPAHTRQSKVPADTYREETKTESKRRKRDGGSAPDQPPRSKKKHDDDASGKKRKRQPQPSAQQTPPAKGKEVREWLTSIGLDECADALINEGCDDLEFISSEMDLHDLVEICRSVGMKEGHLSKLRTRLNDIRKRPIQSSDPASSADTSLTNLSGSADKADAAQADGSSTFSTTSTPPPPPHSASRESSPIDKEQPTALVPANASSSGSSQASGDSSVASEQLSPPSDVQAAAAQAAQAAAAALAETVQAAKRAVEERAEEERAAAHASTGSMPWPNPDYSQIDVSKFDEFMDDFVEKNGPAFDSLREFEQKQNPGVYVEPYIFQKQGILSVLDQDGLTQPKGKELLCKPPQSAFISISSGKRGLGKSKWVERLATALGGLSLTLNLQADAKVIMKMREDTTGEYDLWNERPFMYYCAEKDEESKDLAGGKKKPKNLSRYFEALLNGNKVGGPWPESSKPSIWWEDNDPLPFEIMGNFSGHRIFYLGIESVGDKFMNHAGIMDYPNHKLVVHKAMMEEMGKVIDQQQSKGDFEREAADAGEDDIAVYIFLKYFKIVPYVKNQQTAAGRTHGKDVARKLIELSKEHCPNFFSKTGASFKQKKFNDWYEKTKGKLGTIPIHMWPHGRVEQLNVQLKAVPKFERD